MRSTIPDARSRFESEVVPDVNGHRARELLRFSTRPEPTPGTVAATTLRTVRPVSGRCPHECHRRMRPWCSMTRDPYQQGSGS
jgi:hypothetical protein